MNVPLHKAVTDITGVTGLSIMRAIVRAERDPDVLAGLRQRGVKCGAAEIAQALTDNYRDQHVFSLKQALDAYDFWLRMSS